MPYSDILVHLDDSRSSPARLAAAAALAQAQGAWLSGLYVLPPPDLPINAETYLTAELIVAERQAVMARAEQQEAAFRAAVTPRRLNSEWRCVNGEPGRQVNRHASCHDLVIIGQSDPDDPQAIAGGFVGDVVLGAGRPVLVIPYIGAPPVIGRRVLVAWNGKREAVRALHDALPLLVAAERVTVLSVDGGHGVAAAVPVEDLCAHLARHGVTAQPLELPGSGVGVGDALLDRVADDGSDLIVMGAYGHARLREIVLGGVTRHLLDCMTVPVLMAH